MTTHPPRVAAILTQVAADHGVGVGDMIGPRLYPHLVDARHEAAHRLRSTPGPTGRPTPYRQIAAWIGWSDHSQALRGARRWAEMTAAGR